MKMLKGNLSPLAMFGALAAEHVPSHRYIPGTDVTEWQKQTLPEVLATLGDSPPPVPPEPRLEAEWVAGGLRRQQWLIEVSPHIAARLLVNYPERLSAPAPAILCCHGHGPDGKNTVMGYGSGPEFAARVKQANYNYGEAMAEAGFVTYAIDWIGFGDRCDAAKAHQAKSIGGRDWCNILFLHAAIFGMTSLSINIAHGKAATDFVSTLPEVDAERLGVMGLSGGGTMSLWMSLSDERIKATEIICYSDLFADFGIRDANYCGMQITPGLYKLLDLPDLQSLLAPRPLLVDIGAYDQCFRLESAMACFRRVEAVYATAGASDRLESDIFPGGHGWGGNKSVDFFTRHLKNR